MSLEKKFELLKKKNAEPVPLSVEPPILRTLDSR